MLLAYLSDPDANHTIASLVTRLDDRMTIIKEEAESLEYSELTDETFQTQIASLCVYVTQLKQHIEEAEKDVERFIENAFKKFRSYYDLYQDIQSLISLFTMTTKIGIAEWLKRVPKMEQASNFNVIKICTHSIDIPYKNKALVIPDSNTKRASTTTTPVVEPPVMEFLREGNEGRESIMAKITSVVERFKIAQNEMRVYQVRLAKLGNKELLDRERFLLGERLSDVVARLQGVYFTTTIRNKINGLTTCFDEMVEILNKECANCPEYMFNVVSRSMETSTAYNKLLTILHQHNVDLPCLENESMLVQVESECCSSMF